MVFFRFFGILTGKGAVFMKHPGETIRKLRQEKKLSQEALAERVGVSRQAVTKWESGQSAPSTENLLLLAQIFEVDLNIFVAEPLSAPQQPRREPKNRFLFLYLPLTVAVLGGYLLIDLLGRFFYIDPADLSGWGMLLGIERRFYVFEWLRMQHLLLYCAILSAAGTLLGRFRFGFVTLGGCALGILLGELFGVYKSIDGHSGWLIWSIIIAASIIGGIIWELFTQKHKNNRSN